MEHEKILNLLNEASDSKFVTRNRNIGSNQPNANYSLGNKIIYSAEVNLIFVIKTMLTF